LNSILSFAYCIFDGALYPALFVDYACTLLFGSSGPSLNAGVAIAVKVVVIVFATAVNMGRASLVGQ
jgi:hypothetical protein